MSCSPSSSLPSSPASSPSFGPIDSSPVSSPITNPATLNSPSPSPGVSHPFAANNKAIRPLKLYEKREYRWGAELTDTTFSAAADEDGCTKYDFHVSMSACASSDTETDDFFADDNNESIGMEEHDLWERRISEAIDRGDGLIDLSSTSFGGGITTIPSSIADLEKLVVLPEPPRQSHLSPLPISVASSPTNAPSRTRTFGRAATAPTLSEGKQLFLSSRSSPAGGKAVSSYHAVRSAATSTANEIQLYVANQSIRALPTELFWLGNLTVLSLRGNKLTSIPPQIATSFPHLRELNVSLNELPCLPSEMLALRLESLAVAGNPWLSTPEGVHSSEDAHVRQTSSGSQSAKLRPVNKSLHIGELVHHFAVPPLTELCLRVLMAPASPTLHTLCLAAREHIPARKRELTVLESRYEVPLVRTDFAPLIIETVYGCIPRSVTDQRKNEKRTSNIVHGSPTKKFRTAYSSPVFRNDPFKVSSISSSHSSPSPFSPSRVSTSRSRVRTRSRCSIRPSRSRPSVSHLAVEPPGSARPGINVCPSQLHLNQLGKPVYLGHAVERYTWEAEIAGMNTGEANGVPVLWRGCGPHCLDWLDQKMDMSEGQDRSVETDFSTPGHEAKLANEGEEMMTEFQSVDLSRGFADAFYDSDQ